MYTIALTSALILGTAFAPAAAQPAQTLYEQKCGRCHVAYDPAEYAADNEELAFGGRLNWVYDDFLEVGGSAYHGAWDDDGDLGLTMLGGHFMLRTGWANLYGEWAQATSENLAPAEDGEISGYFIQASRLFQSRYRPAVRWGALDYLDRGNLKGRNPGKGDRELTELAFGFSYYPTAKAVFKIEYTFFGEGDRIEEKDDDQFGLQAAVRFEAILRRLLKQPSSSTRPLRVEPFGADYLIHGSI